MDIYEGINTSQIIDWLVHWLVGALIGWCIGWLVGWLVHWLVLSRRQDLAFLACFVFA